MIQKKVCMLGTFAVGKTSLVARFVRGSFSERYLTTIGVKIDKKIVSTAAGEVSLMIWDIYGDDDYQAIKPSFLRGASGFFLVVDGTRQNSLERISSLKKLQVDVAGNIPFIILLNKIDLQSEWVFGAVEEQQLAELGPVIKTSAKTGQGVEQAFSALAWQMLKA